MAVLRNPVTGDDPDPDPFEEPTPRPPPREARTGRPISDEWAEADRAYADAIRREARRRRGQR